MATESSAPLYPINVVRLKLITQRTMFIDYDPVATAATAARICQQYFNDLDRELMLVLIVNLQRRIMAIHPVAMGAENCLVIKPKQIFQVLFQWQCSVFLLAHNHPSGNPLPSREDVVFTRKVWRLGRDLGYKLWDHLILGRDEAAFSFREHRAAKRVVQRRRLARGLSSVAGVVQAVSAASVL